MSADLKTVEAQALRLSAEERAQLADRLLASLFEDRAIEAAWEAELERRIEDIERGRSMLVPLDESLRKARSAIKWLRRSVRKRVGS